MYKFVFFLQGMISSQPPKPWITWPENHKVETF